MRTNETAARCTSMIHFHYHSFASLKHHSQSETAYQRARSWDQDMRESRTSKHIAIIVNYAAPDLVGTRASKHAGWRLLRLKVLNVRLALGVDTVRAKHLIHSVHCKETGQNKVASKEDNACLPLTPARFTTCMYRAPCTKG